MLTTEENEKVTRVGPGTPCGEFMRRYWQPAALSKELPENDGSPLRVRLLGEDLIAYRGSDGKIGLVDAYCPHRRAPLFFARNEECGLRCVYHGWKFDSNGDCVDMPSEPAGTTLQGKVKIKAYPCVERGGIVWAYMGPKATMPDAPDYEWMRAPATHRHASKTFENANFLQCLEGGLDTAHSSFTHNNSLGDNTLLRARDKAPRIDVELTDYGYYYVSHRRAGEDGNYIRLYQYVMPTQQIRPSIFDYHGKRNNPARIDGHIWVPIDDTTTFVYNFICGWDKQDAYPEDVVEARETSNGRGSKQLIPGTFRLKANQSNDYFIDRQMQKTKNFTGIVGVNTQDFALQEGMGPICDRSKEFLGTSDKAIVSMRRLFLEGIDTVSKGGTPRGAKPETHRDVRPYENLVAHGADWKPLFEKERAPKW